MKNIHVLKSDKPSRLHLGNSGLVLCVSPFNNGTISSHHIYITSDEKIKEGDWVISDQSLLSPLYDAIGKVEIINLETKKIIQSDNSWYWTDLDCKKIILTTDPDLIKDGIQEIDDEFLEWFVENPSCEFVKTEPIYYAPGYHLDIPQEEPKQENCCTPIGQIKRYLNCVGCDRKPNEELHTCKYCGVATTQPDDECYAKPEQEKLEEIANSKAFEFKVDYKPFETDLDYREYAEYGFKKGFIDGTKWQTEQSGHKISEAFQRGLNALIPLIENLQNEITKLKRNL